MPPLLTALQVAERKFWTLVQLLESVERLVTVMSVGNVTSKVVPAG